MVSAVALGGRGGSLCHMYPKRIQKPCNAVQRVSVIGPSFRAPCSPFQGGPFRSEKPVFVSFWVGSADSGRNGLRLAADFATRSGANLDLRTLNSFTLMKTS